jgi:5-formyltetrahydrofolate cyclo-ligase
MAEHGLDAKRGLRGTIRRRRRERTHTDPYGATATGPDVEQPAEQLADHVEALPEVAAARRVAAYVSRPGEPGTEALLRRWRAAGREVLLPVLLPDLDLDWALDDGRLAPGERGLLEPVGARLGPDAIATADVVVAPALAVDRLGRRLGQGGGSYDRALARLTASTLVVALVHADELLDESLPVEPHDRPVHVVVTPAGAVRFPRP